MYSPALSGSITGTPLFALTDPLDWFLDGVWGTAMDGVAEATGMDVLGYSFMQQAFLAAICIAVIGPLVGSFLVHREMAMIGDTLAHSAFAGVAVGIFADAALSWSVSPLLTALLVAVVAGLLVQALVDHADAATDTSLAIVLTGSFALGSVLVTATDGGISVGINAYLFGSLATVSRSNTHALLAMTGVVCVVVALAYRPLVYVTFDEVGARAAGLDVGRYNQLLVVLTAVVVVGAMQIMGVILVAAMLVIPVAAASSATGFKRSIGLAILAGQLSTIAGVLVSYQYDVAAGGSIVLVAIAVFVLARTLGLVRVGDRVRSVLAARSSGAEAPAAPSGRADADASGDSNE